MSCAPHHSRPVETIRWAHWQQTLILTQVSCWRLAAGWSGSFWEIWGPTGARRCVDSVAVHAYLCCAFGWSKRAHFTAYVCSSSEPPVRDSVVWGEWVNANANALVSSDNDLWERTSFLTIDFHKLTAYPCVIIYLHTLDSASQSIWGNLKRRRGYEWRRFTSIHTHTCSQREVCTNKKSKGFLKTASACRLQVRVRDVLLISNPLSILSSKHLSVLLLLDPSVPVSLVLLNQVVMFLITFKRQIVCYPQPEENKHEWHE